MKILIISPCELKRELGASKHLIELAEELRQLNWTCDLVAPSEIHKNGVANEVEFAEALRKFLIQHAEQYDVVEYSQQLLPFPRQDFSANTLFVARSVLLHYHFLKIAIPPGRTVKELVYHYTKEQIRRRTWLAPITKRVNLTLASADLINVNNEDDRIELEERGFNRNKICVIPCGLSTKTRNAIAAMADQVPRQPKIAFIGTFDRRKGAPDMPAIFDYIHKELPEVTFKLLGTYKNESEVKAYFPKSLHSKIEVVPHYASFELPSLLAGCSVGIFPSYIEGFGLGVLEMLTASIPVIAYNSPGPPMMLRSEYLVARGEKRALATKVVDLMQDHKKLKQARIEAQEISKKFSWKKVAAQTAFSYSESLDAVRKAEQLKI